MSIARNSIVTLAGTATAVVVTIVTVPLYIDAIGLERYGVLAVVWTILTYFGLFELGVSGGLVQRLARGGLSARDRVSLYWTGFCMNSAMGLFAGLVLLLTFGSIISLMNFSTAEVEKEVQSSGGVIAALVVVMTIRSVNNGVLYGAERFMTATILSTLEVLLSAIAPLAVAIYASLDIYWLLSAVLAVRVGFLVVSFVAMIPSLPGFRLTSGRIAQARDLLSIGLWFWLAGVIGPLLTYFDRFLIGGMVGVAHIPYYSVPQTICQQSSQVPRALGTVLFPRFSAVNDDTAAMTLAIKAMEAMAFIVTPISVILILTIGPILTIWLSEDFASKSALIGAVIMLSLFPSAMARIVVSQLNGCDRPDLVGKVLLLEIIPYALGLYALTKSFGLLGVAIAGALRAAADAALLGAASRTLIPMLKVALWPTGFALSALLTSIAGDYLGPLRWMLSLAVCVALASWLICLMPPSLACRINRVPLVGRMPVGRFYASKPN